MGLVTGAQKELHVGGWLKGAVPWMVELAQVQGGQGWLIHTRNWHLFL